MYVNDIWKNACVQFCNTRGFELINVYGNYFEYKLPLDNDVKVMSSTELADILFR